MKSIIITILLLTPIIGQSATVHKCKDENGRSVFSQQPCDGNTEKMNVTNKRNGLGKPPSNKTAQQHQELDRKYRGRISSYALSPYTPKGYPKTIAKYGLRLTEIEVFRKLAAYMALESGKCDFVEIAELSTSSTINALKFWVDCQNRERIYLTESEIRKGSAIRTQAEKSWTKPTAISACKKAIKDRALIPSSADIHEIFGTSYYKAPTTHNVVLNMDFDVINALGNEIPYTAKCHFKPGEVGTIEIRYR